MTALLRFRPDRLPAALTLLLTGLLFGGRPARVSAQEVRGFDTVVLDAGHGGHDRGGSPGQRGIAEKTVTLDTSLRLKRILENRGLRVIMTRSSDDFIPLSQRVGATAGRNPRRTIFLSVHFNGAPREGARGIETYYYRSDSFALATRLHRNLVGAMETDDRFVRRRPFYVIRNARVPAVLCECGFLTNNEEEHRIAGPEYRQRLAETLASGLLAQRSSGNLANLGSQPAVTTERLGGGRRYAHRGGRHSGRHHYASRSRGGGRHGRHLSSSRRGKGKARSAHHATSSRRKHRRS